MDIVKKALRYSLATTIIIFILGFLANATLDYSRATVVESSIQDAAVRAEAYLLQQDFYDVTGSYSCEQLQQQATLLQQQYDNVSIDLSLYKGQTIAITAEYERLRAQQTQSQLRFLYSYEQIRSQCNLSTPIVLFFFEQDDEASITQSFILQDIKRDQSVLTLGFDLDSSEPALKRFTIEKNITVPSLVIGAVVYPVVVYQDELLLLLQKNI